MLQLQVLPQQEGYFLARLEGLVSVEAWGAGLCELESALAQTKHDRVVVILTGLVGGLGVPERMEVGALMARHLARAKKVAMYIQAEKIQGVVEAEARRLGLDLRILPSQDECVEWVGT